MYCTCDFVEWFVLQNCVDRPATILGVSRFAKALSTSNPERMVDEAQVGLCTNTGPVDYHVITVAE